MSFVGGGRIWESSGSLAESALETSDTIQQRTQSKAVLAYDILCRAPASSTLIVLPPKNTHPFCQILTAHANPQYT